MSERKCFVCERPGHIATNCPQKKRPADFEDKEDRKGKKPMACLVPDMVGDKPNFDASELCRAWGKVRDQIVLVFFDPGAKANFISPELWKFLVVTCNYEARQRGVPKMALIQTAKERCPDLVLFNGEDLTPYRAASKNIMAVLGRFGVLERRGLDEAALDITEEVMKRVALMPNHQGFAGHVVGLTEIGCDCHCDPSSSTYFLMVGSQLVFEIRAVVEGETGFRCSSGIAINKMLAKLVSSVNKPNQQTCILDSGVSEFLTPLSVRKLPGIGHRTESLLKDMGITTVADLQKTTFQELSTKQKCCARQRTP
ncbi:hypothetical protein L7F22_063928 [Adiantum nelumboides]|nr:hypothetical protein [Adiantum nelumboides]